MIKSSASSSLVHFINEKQFTLTEGETLLCQALKQQIPHVHECGGKGLCSTCRVIVEAGLENCSPETEAEREIKSRKNLPSEVRLSCQLRPTGSITVRRLVRDHFDIQLALENGLNPSAKTQPIAIMFCDIRNFTEFSQCHLPYDVTHILNRFFSAMTAAVNMFGGHVDKLLGDGMMVLFGLDEQQRLSPSDQALFAAEQMLKNLQQLNQYYQSVFDHQFQIGIGIDYGYCLLGEFGSAEHRSFTALGQRVNRAARIESLCKTYQTWLLVSDDVRENCQQPHPFTQSMDVHLKGIREATRIWQLCYPIQQQLALAPEAIHADSALSTQDQDMLTQVEALSEVIGSPTIAVAASYQGDQIKLCIGLVRFLEQHQLEFTIPTGHSFNLTDWVTLHLDNRTGVEEYDAELRVFRTSYKGRVQQVKNQNTLIIDCREFSLVHGMSEVLGYRERGYHYPADARPLKNLPTTPLTTMPVISQSEHDNKIGVLITRTPEQPHTTAMAFLSSEEDDIFIISFPSTFKVQQLQKDNRCCFAIDERASFTFENAIDWNYVLIDAEAYEVPLGHPIYEPIKAAFIDKNPWEVGFFANPEVRIYHLKCLGTLFHNN
ncbi:Adenylate cyclase, class 3 [Oceanospirillum multiglobuliferum]|nr:Adenylate cyclase, class 3 [Oceanospirillum multiglobuliferum]